MVIDFSRVSEIQTGGRHVSAVWKNNKLLWSDDQSGAPTVIRTAGTPTLNIELITPADPEKPVIINFGD